MLVKPRQSLISILQNQIHEADGDAQDIMNTQVDQNKINTAVFSNSSISRHFASLANAFSAPEPA